MMRIFSVTLLLCALAGPSVLAAHSNDKAASGTTTDAAKNTRAVSMATATPSMTGPATNTPAASAMTTPVATTANGGNPANGANAAVEGELQQLRELLEAQQAEITALKERLNSGASANAVAGPPARAGAASANGAASPSANGRVSLAAAMPQSDQPKNESDDNMSFRIGGVNFTPGGFVDFSNYWRSTNVGSGFGTSFNTIPFNNTSAGGLTEDHITAVNSRLSLTVRSHVAAGDVLGYLETDFNGNQPTNLLVNRNSATLRLRLFFADYRRGNWEILGGQDWTMLTPDRMGIGALPADLFTTLDIDSNNNVGLVSARQPQFRLVYHPTEYWAMGVSVENPDQYTGTAITFPSAFNPSSGTTYTNQVDQGIGTNSPAYFPDIIAKIARDQLVGGKDWHFEVAGLLTSDKLYTPAAVTGGTTATQSKTGGGIAGNMDLALTHSFHLIANTFWSDGGGRYIYALGPNFVVAQDPNSLNFLPSLVHAGSGLGGFEWQATRKFQWFAYYGGAYFGRNFSIDSATMKDVGYGYTGSSNSQNRAIQEISTGFTHSFWKSENYGALQLINQVSWVTRAPWYVTPATSSTPGAPKNANAAVVYVDLRYVIP